MLRDFSGQSFFMGLLTAFVGFVSSFAVVLQGLKGVGATDVQAASGLMALSISMGICAIVLSAFTRLPVSIAWSTPGGALLATTGAVEGGFNAAVGAFLICALLIIVAGLFKPLGRAVAAIPSSLANAMLAGVLLSLCFAPVKAIGFNPALTPQASHGLEGMRHRIEACGGRLDVSSASGKGTRITATIPRQQRKPHGELASAMDDMHMSSNSYNKDAQSPTGATG